MNRWVSRSLAGLLILFLLSGCSALQALEKLRDQDETDQPTADSDQTANSDQTADSPTEPEKEPSSEDKKVSDAEKASDTEKPSVPKRPEEKGEPAPDPLDFADEDAIRAVLEGEWIYCPPLSNDPAVWITFDQDGGFHIKVKNPEDGTTWEDNGFCQLEHLTAEEQEAPDMMMLAFSEPSEAETTYRRVSYVGDFLIFQRSVYDGEAALALMQVNNGDSIFSVYFDDWAPVLKRYTGWQSQGETRKSESFYAAVWKIDYETQTIWLDDAEKGARNIGRYEAVPYQAAPQMDFRSLPDGMVSNGTIWAVRTDDMGRVEEMQPIIYRSEEQLSEEEAAELLCELDEVQKYLELGMTMLFEGNTEIIGEEPCVVITLGTDHEEKFVRELSYAVSPSGGIYVYDVITDSWNIVNAA